MALQIEYAWLKVVKVEELEHGQTASGPAPELADFAVWSCDASTTTGRTLIPNPPLPGGAALRDAGGDGAVVVPTCAGCPTQPTAAPVPVADRFVTPPPLPSAAGAGAPTEGWQMESGTLLTKFDERPEVVFSMRPVPGDRLAALNWLKSPDGKQWVEGALACTLLSYFHS
ncbi:hypothetical protein [Roseateles sp.]|uniref:hypothetical protein n=1 Tax=Roseateles sp. TaxID=1971397 RepID=UPI0039ED9B9B